MINSNCQNLANQYILVIDDSLTIGILVSEVLTGCGAAKTMALTSQAALNLFSSNVSENNSLVSKQVGVADFDEIFLSVPGEKSWEILDLLFQISQNHPEILSRVILVKNDNCREATICRIHQTKLPIIPKSFLLNELKAVACN
jgi:hypothetical protein